MIVDIGLPGRARRLRRLPPPGAAGPADVPVLILSARDDEVDRMLGLELGADDYVTKPFSARELVARVHAILRRTRRRRRPAGGRRPSAGVDVDSGRREVAGTARSWSPRHPRVRPAGLPGRRTTGLALSRQQLLDGVWGEGWYGDERTVDVHVRQLRKKLGPDLPLATVWGVGYRLG